MGTLSLIVAIDNRQLISIRSVKRLQRLTLCTHSNEGYLHLIWGESCHASTKECWPIRLLRSREVKMSQLVT